MEHVNIIILVTVERKYFIRTIIMTKKNKKKKTKHGAIIKNFFVE